MPAVLRGPAPHSCAAVSRIGGSFRKDRAVLTKRSLLPIDRSAPFFFFKSCDIQSVIRKRTDRRGPIVTGTQERGGAGQRPHRPLMVKLALPAVAAQLIICCTIRGPDLHRPYRGGGRAPSPVWGVTLPLLMLISAIPPSRAWEAAGSPPSAWGGGPEEAERILAFERPCCDFGSRADGGVSIFKEPLSWPSAPRRDHRLCPGLYLHLSDGHRLRPAGPGPQRLYSRQGPGPGGDASVLIERC